MSGGPDNVVRRTQLLQGLVIAEEPVHRMVFHPEFNYIGELYRLTTWPEKPPGVLREGDLYLAEVVDSADNVFTYAGKVAPSYVPEFHAALCLSLKPCVYAETTQILRLPTKAGGAIGLEGCSVANEAKVWVKPLRRLVPFDDRATGGAKRSYPVIPRIYPRGIVVRSPVLRMVEHFKGQPFVECVEVPWRNGWRPLDLSNKQVARRIRRVRKENYTEGGVIHSTIDIRKAMQAGTCEWSWKFAFGGMNVYFHALRLHTLHVPVPGVVAGSYVVGIVTWGDVEFNETCVYTTKAANVFGRVNADIVAVLQACYGGVNGGAEILSFDSICEMPLIENTVDHDVFLAARNERSVKVESVMFVASQAIVTLRPLIGVSSPRDWI